MLTYTTRWSHPPGNAVVPSPWQATVYRATGHLQVISIAPPSASEVFTFDLTLRLVNAAGVGFRAHALEHVTITPDGDLTSSVDNFEIRCGA
jgi:hypothetical protein